MKIFLGIVIFWTVLICSSCNFPDNSKPLSPQDIATAVASTLTAQPNNISNSGISTTPIGEQQPQIGASQVLPVEILFTPSATIIPTNGPTPTQTFTPTPEDPRQNFGEPAWRSSLDSGKAFGVSGSYQDDTGNEIQIQNGLMTMTNPNTGGYLMWRLTIPSPDNVYIEAKYISQNCFGNDQFGITFRAPDYSSGYGYYFGITCDGNFNLYRRDDGAGKTILLPLTPSPFIRSGSGQQNTLGVWMRSNNIKLFANGKLLQDISDLQYILGGHFGPYIMGYSGSNSISLDDIAYWIVP